MYRTNPTGKIKIAAVAAAAALLLAACGDGSSAAGDKGDGKPKAGGTLTVALGGDPVSVNPRAVTPLVREVSRPIVDSLLALDPATKKPVPWLAESVKANADATEFTFKLRSGVTFSDGTPLTAKVVKDNFDDIVANKAKTAGSSSVALLDQGGYKGTDAPDDLTVVQHFAKPYPTWPLWAAGTAFGILAPKTLALPLDARFDKIVGSGPFVLQSYTKNSQVVLTKRTGYKWGPKTAKNAGDAYLDKVVYKVITEPSVRTGALKTGQVQLASALNPADIAPVRAAGYAIVAQRNPRLAEGLVVTGADRAPLNDVAVRQALVKAVDAKQVRDTLLTPEWGVPDSVVTGTTVGHADESALLKPDQQAAAALLDKAGWKAGSDGIRTKDGKRLTVKLGWLDRGNPWDQPLVELVTAQYKKIGVELKPELATAAQSVAALTARTKWDLFLSGVAGALDAGVGLAGTFSTAPPNFYNIQDAPLQPLLAKQATTTDEAARNTILADAQRRILSEGLFTPLVEDTNVVATGKKVHGFAFDADSRLPTLQDVWLS
ncbi:ABC transporter substrate-binding protein [Actinomadura parmotrematis]|uniref:ABC transporter substrate-binding protein n=1 Tax=Actinomadura parmotrematis TaxID=2864039 RepID=A0ABS7FLL3_9ACTN|nr:ABC transporter substrate-binding protein [Actinomadura parmotrematis]MBW8481258.1 ABC transporter substrate-binding protein [Actinomadura parmotrematis]